MMDIATVDALEKLATRVKYLEDKMAIMRNEQLKMEEWIVRVEEKVR